MTYAIRFATDSSRILVTVAIGVSLAVFVDPVLLLFALAGAIVVSVILARGDHLILSPLGPVLLVIVTSAFLPALFGILSQTPRFALDHQDYVRAAWGFTLFIILMCLTYLPRGQARVVRIRVWDGSSGVHRLVFLWIICCVWALAALALLGGPDFEAYIAELGNRRIYFEGQAWALWALVSPSVALLVLIASQGNSLRHARKRLIFTLVAMSGLCLAFVALTGNRMNVVVFLASLSIVIHRRVKPLGLRPVLLGVLFVGILGLSLPTYLRPQGQSEREFRLRSLMASLSDIQQSGAATDFGQIAGLAMVMEDSRQLHLEFGKTYLAAATIGLPRALFPWKLPGAGEVVTERLLPDLWLGGTVIQMTAPGEAYLNFGWFGIVLVPVVFGLALRFLRRYGLRRDLFGTLLFAITLPRAALIVRGEFANVVAFWLMEVAIIAIAFLLLRRWSRASKVAVPS